jgi:hypothetical protein
MRIKVRKSSLKTSTLAHHRIDEHEKLCRIMQKQTNDQINDIKNRVIRLEKLVITSGGALITGMAYLIFKLI